nr:MAG TPA: hypothetical protein [Caudoviricetes sp.]
MFCKTSNCIYGFWDLFDYLCQRSFKAPHIVK